LSLAFIKNGEMNAVIIVIIPINGKRKALTAPKSTPTLTITIENSPLGAAKVNADLSELTMEIAQQLTGVTMNEPGVSRLVAVDVEEAASLAEA